MGDGFSGAHLQILTSNKSFDRWEDSERQAVTSNIIDGSLNNATLWVNFNIFIDADCNVSVIH